MKRYFYIEGTCVIPTRFYTVVEITTKTTLRKVAKAVQTPFVEKIDGVFISSRGFIRRVLNDRVQDDHILNLHNFRTI